MSVKKNVKSLIEKCLKYTPEDKIKIDYTVILLNELFMTLEEFQEPYC